MFIQKEISKKVIAYNYTDALIEDYNNSDSFENNYIVLSIPKARLLYLAKTWNCPKNNVNRQLLPESEWKKERDALLSYGNSLQINSKAELCGTFHKYGTSYLVWLEFTGPDNIVHKLDTFINETSKRGELYATKVIDGVKCETVYNDIISTGRIDPIIAKKLHSIGSIKWTGSAETKVQYKLNSWKQQSIFEAAANECDFITLKQLDQFDIYLYKGDPGQLADYDLTVKLENGATITTRVDLKLLLSRITLAEQVPHDAELLIASTLLSHETAIERRDNFNSVIKIEETAEFKKFISKFEEKLQEARNCYLSIDYIDINTGKIKYNFYC